MQTKKAFCRYCKKEGLINKHSDCLRYMCVDCRKIWHKLRVRHEKFGEGIDIHQLVMWYISQPQVCKECGSKDKITIDRIIPEKNGGKYEWGNIQLLCYKCNCCIKREYASVSKSLEVPKEIICTKCKKLKPLTLEFFHKASFKPKYSILSKSSFHPHCKECRSYAESMRYMLNKKPTRLKKIKHTEIYNKLYGFIDS